ncbi:hypothetical protein F4778DRAFT_762769, partial [Xylariomycetidae sp. FL2044]
MMMMMMIMMLTTGGLVLGEGDVDGESEIGKAVLYPRVTSCVCIYIYMRISALSSSSWLRGRMGGIDKMNHPFFFSHRRDILDHIVGAQKSGGDCGTSIRDDVILRILCFFFLFFFSEI